MEDGSKLAESRTYEFLTLHKEESVQWARVLSLIIKMQRVGLPLKQVNPYDFEQYLKLRKIRGSTKAGEAKSISAKYPGTQSNGTKLGKSKQSQEPFDMMASGQQDGGREMGDAQMGLDDVVFKQQVSNDGLQLGLQISQLKRSLENSGDVKGLGSTDNIQAFEVD